MRQERRRVCEFRERCVVGRLLHSSDASRAAGRHQHVGAQRGFLDGDLIAGLELHFGIRRLLRPDLTVVQGNDKFSVRARGHFCDRRFQSVNPFGRRSLLVQFFPRDVAAIAELRVGRRRVGAGGTPRAVARPPQRSRPPPSPRARPQRRCLDRDARSRGRSRTVVVRRLFRMRKRARWQAAPAPALQRQDRCR